MIKVYSNLDEMLFISSDVDDPARYKRYPIRPPGHYISCCHIPGNLLNLGTFVVGVNASIPYLKRYFADQHGIQFRVDGAGAVGSPWVVEREGFFRPALRWDIEDLERSAPDKVLSAPHS